MTTNLSRDTNFSSEINDFNSERREFSFSDSNVQSLSYPQKLREKLKTEFVRIKQKWVFFWNKHRKKVQLFCYAFLVIFFHIYLIFAMLIKPKEAIILVVITSFVWAYLIYYFIFLKHLKPLLVNLIGTKVDNTLKLLKERGHIHSFIYLALIVALVAFLAIDTKGERHRLISLGGLFFYLLFLWIFSKHPGNVNWRPVIWGIGLQFTLGLIILRWHTGFLAFTWISDRITQFLDYVHFGTTFVFGFLVDPPNICGMAPVFTFAILPVLIFFSSFVAILYHVGAMQFILDRVGWMFQMTMGTTAAESMCAAGDIFFGMSEAPIMIQPFLNSMTKSVSL